MIANLNLADLALIAPVVCLAAIAIIASYPLPSYAEAERALTPTDAYRLLIEHDVFYEWELDRLLVNEGWTAIELVGRAREQGLIPDA